VSATTIDAALSQALAVLREACEGPPERWSYFTDNSPDAGLFGTLDRCDAALASRPVCGATSIAAHVDHAAFAMEGSAGWIRGERAKLDWKSSWSVSQVDASRWEALKARLRSGYDALRSAIRQHGADSEESFGEAVGAVAHAAYHLGAIRQKLAAARP
jgi:hypothetical protein